LVAHRLGPAHTEQTKMSCSAIFILDMKGNVSSTL
jgi:hypothetical protein